jgi:glyoxylase-like metal-dependent hydrolase (beta-lactamase superfamily II)
MTVHQLNIGDIECAVLQEGEASKTIDRIAERYPTVERSALASALGGKPAQDSLNCLYVNSGGKRILADVGFGTAGPPDCGRLLAALASIGVALGDIDIVYLTHFHGDHVAGLLADDGRLSFPNARFVTTKAEWDEWTERWQRSSLGHERRQLQGLMALRERIDFVQPGDTVAPGVSVVDLAGHTRGQCGLLIESANQRLFHAVDLLHQAFQLAHTDWHFVFDSDPAGAVATRKRVLQQCADEGLLTLFYHLPFPGLGKVTVDGGTFVWNPTG